MIAAPQQLDFPSLAFPPDRSALYVFEVARKLKCAERHVLNLIQCGQLRAINIATDPDGRKCYRIPIESYDEYLKKNLL